LRNNLNSPHHLPFIIHHLPFTASWQTKQNPQILHILIRTKSTEDPTEVSFGAVDWVNPFNIKNATPNIHC